MRKSLVVLTFAAGLALSNVGIADSQHGAMQAGPGNQAVVTQMALRDLWLGHIFWVREVVSATVAKDAGAVAVAEGRAVDNAKQIASAIEPFYGRAASDQLFKLLAGHYTAIKGNAEATVAGNSGEAKNAAVELAANAREIGAFLSKANPHLQQQTLDALLTAHGGHHLQQNQQLAKGDRSAEARTWDEMRAHIYSISDALTAALVKQFPGKF
jgi:hypothetical protein